MTKFFCVKPWTHLVQHSNGTFTPCCKIEEPLTHNDQQALNIKEAWDSTDLEKLRQSFLRGDKPQSCSQCWATEEAGGVSDRISTNTRVRSSIGNNAYLSLFNSPPLLRSIDLKISNLCNLKCRICSLGYSSQIFQESLEINPEYIDRYQKDANFFRSRKWEKIQNKEEVMRELFENIEYMEVYGGEPFLQQDILHLLEFCAKEKLSGRISLRFHTNGTIPLIKFLPILKNFKQVNMVFSIDDIGQRFEYQRKGADWLKVNAAIEEVIKNINQQNLCNIIPEIFCTVSIYNIFYLENLLDWAGSKGMKVDIPPLHTPPYLSIQHLPDSLKELLISKMDKIINNKWLHYMEEAPQTLANILKAPADNIQWTHFILYTMSLDYFRDESFANIYPEIYPYFEKYFRKVNPGVKEFHEFSKGVFESNANFFCNKISRDL